MSMDKVQLKQEDVLDGQVVLSDINPVTNTKSIEDSATGLPMTETVSRMWAAINNKLSRVVNSVNGRTGVVVLTSEDVGLGNVDNVSYAEIKQWVIDTFEDLFGENHFRIYETLSEAITDANEHGKSYDKVPFYAKQGQMIIHDNGDGTETQTMDYRAFIGFFYWDNAIGITYSVKAINVVGWSDNSIVYVKDDLETFRGNGANPLPIGGIGVNIHHDEDALIVRNPSGVKSESGLAIVKANIVPRVYYFTQMYHTPDTTDEQTHIVTRHYNGLLWSSDRLDTTKGPVVTIIIDGDTKSGEHYLQKDGNGHLADYRTGDLIICNFNGEYNERGSEVEPQLVPSDADGRFLFRNTALGRFKSAPSIDAPDDPYVIEFSSIMPRVGYGLKMYPTHRNEDVTDFEVTLHIARSVERNSWFNATPFNARKDPYGEQNPKGVTEPYTRYDYNNPWINTPWSIDEGASTSRHVNITGVYGTQYPDFTPGGMVLEMDNSLCIMPMRLVRAGNPPTDENPLGDEYVFDKDSHTLGERVTRPYGSLIAGNWHHPYIYYDDIDPRDHGYLTHRTLLSVNLSKVIMNTRNPVHGSYTKFFNMSGLRMDYSTDVAYNGASTRHDGRVADTLEDITDAFNETTITERCGMTDHFDTDGVPFRDLVPIVQFDGHNRTSFAGGICINVGKYLEIRPLASEKSAEYYNGGKVQLRAGHGTEETHWYALMHKAGVPWNNSASYVNRPSDETLAVQWNNDNKNPKYMFYCIPGYVTEFLAYGTHPDYAPSHSVDPLIPYEDWLCDEEPFIRQNIMEIPRVPSYELVEDEYCLLTEEPDEWDKYYQSYYYKNDQDQYVHVEPEGTPPAAPVWKPDMYYKFGPTDWIQSVLVLRSWYAEHSDAYDIEFNTDNNHIDPLKLRTKIPNPVGTYDTQKEYSATWFTKVGDTFVPVRFDVSSEEDPYPYADTRNTSKSWYLTTPVWEPNKYYRLTSKRVPMHDLDDDYSLVWLKASNRLGVKPDRETLKIKTDGSLGVVSPVIQYQPGEAYHKNQMVEYNGKVYICIKDYYSCDYTQMVKDTMEYTNMPTFYTEEPHLVRPDEYQARFNTYRAVSVAADMEAGYLSNRFSMDAVVQYEVGQSYGYGQLVQYDGLLYLVIRSYGDYKSISIEDDIDNGYLSDAFNTSKRKILYFRDIRGRSFEFDPQGTVKTRNSEAGKDENQLKRSREYEYVKLGPGLRITGGKLPPEVECNKTELRESLLEEVERMSVAEEIMYARTLDPTFGTTATFKYDDGAEQAAEQYLPGSMYTMGTYVRSGSYLYLCIKNYETGGPEPYTAKTAVEDKEAGYLAEYSKIYDDAGTIESLTSIEDVMNLDTSFVATIETVGDNVDEAIIKNTILSKNSTLTELRTFKATLDTIRSQLEDPKVFFPTNKEYLLDDWRTLQNRVRAMVLTANNKKDASTKLYPELIKYWFGDASSVQPTFKAIQSETNDFLKVEIRTLEWLFTTWATMVRNSSELAATFVEDQNLNRCDYCACGDADVICNHDCPHCTKNPENKEGAYYAYAQYVGSTTASDGNSAAVYDSLNTETHRILFYVPYGERVVCLPIKTADSWVKVALNGQVGYALKSDFKIPQDFNSIPETVMYASVYINDILGGIQLYNDSLIVSDDTKIGEFHSNINNIIRDNFEILNSEWTQLTIQPDNPNDPLVTGYILTARLIFTTEPYNPTP